MARAQTPTTGGVVGPRTSVRGRVTGSGDLRIEGGVDGDVAVDGALTVAEGAEVTADVKAASVLVEGTLTGDVESAGPVAVRAGARVAGTLRGARVSIDEGASVSGRVECAFDLPAEIAGGGGR